MWSRGLVEDRFSAGETLVITTENCNAYEGLLLGVDDECISIIQRSSKGEAILYTSIQLYDIEAISICERASTIDTLKDIANENNDGEEDKGETESANS